MYLCVLYIYFIKNKYNFSYPAIWVVPSLITDDGIRRFYRNYRHNRVPIITWRHQQTSALLLRGAGYHGKNLIGMLKSTHPSSAGILINKCFQNN